MRVVGTVFVFVVVVCVAGCGSGDDPVEGEPAPTPTGLGTCNPWNEDLDEAKNVRLVNAGRRAPSSGRRVLASAKVVRPGATVRIALDNRRAEPTEIGVGYELQRRVDGRWASSAYTLIHSIALGIRGPTISPCVTVNTAPNSKPGLYRVRLTSERTPFVPIRISGEPIG